MVDAAAAVEEPTPARVGVCAEPATDAGLRTQAEGLARQLALPVAAGFEAGFDGLLVVTPAGLELRWLAPTTDTPGESRRAAPIRVDLIRLDTMSGPGRSLRQPLAKAVGLPQRRAGEVLHILDATGGFGEDAWLLAAWGCRVSVHERHPVVAALLSDGLRRAASEQPDIAGRITLHVGDARGVLLDLDDSQRPDVIYLDPMFPPRTGSALERKPMRVLRRLVGHDDDVAALFVLALRQARRRVVLKRPSHAPHLASAPPPVASHAGKGFRFDVYVIAS